MFVSPARGSDLTCKVSLHSRSRTEMWSSSEVALKTQKVCYDGSDRSSVSVKGDFNREHWVPITHLLPTATHQHFTGSDTFRMKLWVMSKSWEREQRLTLTVVFTWFTVSTSHSKCCAAQRNQKHKCICVYYCYSTESSPRLIWGMSR